MKRLFKLGSFTRGGVTFYPSVWLLMFLSGIVLGEILKHV